MPTIQDSIVAVLAESTAPLAPADIHAELERRGVETSVDYVYQVLNTLKKERRAHQPRSGRWEATPPDALRWPRDEPERAAPRGVVLFEIATDDGRVIGEWRTDGHQVGEPVRVYVRTRPERDSAAESVPTPPPREATAV